MKTSTFLPDRDAKIDARLSRELHQRILRIAAMKDVKPSEIVRQALREYAANYEAQANKLAA